MSARFYEDCFRSVGILVFLMALAGFQLVLVSQRRRGFRVSAERTSVP